MNIFYCFTVREALCKDINEHRDACNWNASKLFVY